MINLGQYTNEVLDKYRLKDHPTGSNYICDPPVTNTDIDWVVLVRSNPVPELEELGWELCGEDMDYDDGQSDFDAIRRQNINLILVYEEEEFNRWVDATESAKKLNLTNKQDRIDHFLKFWPQEQKEEVTESKSKRIDVWYADDNYYPEDLWRPLPNYIIGYDFSQQVYKIEPIPVVPEKEKAKNFGAKMREINNKIKKEMVRKNGLLNHLLGLVR